MNNTKFLKIIFINIIIIVLIFCIIEYGSFLLAKHLRKQYEPDFNMSYFIKMNYSYKKNYEYLKQFHMRKPEGLNYKKRPIVIFGCSYTYGGGLDNKQTFSYKLSHLNKRLVHNRAICTWGLQHMLYQLQQEPFLDTIKDPEYVIYVFMSDHITRMFLSEFDPIHQDIYLQYVLKNNELRIKQLASFDKIVNRFFCYKLFQKYYANKIVNDKKFFDKNFDLMKLYFIESKKIVDKKYPNTKFVILKYNQSIIQVDDWYIETKKWKELENLGFIIVDTKELTQENLNIEKYKLSKTDFHPNEKVWDIIVPALSKRLNL